MAWSTFYGSPKKNRYVGSSAAKTDQVLLMERPHSVIGKNPSAFLWLTLLPTNISLVKVEIRDPSMDKIHDLSVF
jgi:hypothetical protein